MSSKKRPIIEVCIDSLESATEAVAGGAARLEICANLGVGGGTTPSLGLIMIRSRIGDFVFTKDEVAVMLEDINIYKQENVTGVVIGILKTDGTVDIERTRILVQAAKPMEVCFHRAIDMTRDPLEAIKDIDSIGGIDRVLTSGHGPSAPHNIDMLTAMAKLSLSLPSPITILPGSGINPTSVHIIVQCDWWKSFGEIHMSAGRWLDSPMKFRKEHMSMGAGENKDWQIWRAEENAVKQVQNLVVEAFYVKL
ncbi:hypothetical protein Clacol_007615 [Clathrus columnatus]|uniref:Copper homeostasis protein cutC homolog n=1 Tax=Clathrus columnatus TaxID=1419009 RepID=A0AAV5AKZ8_9AGAM|nr:hypothetical protein Clacol_007615 [Clathrus columnatus]